MAYILLYSWLELQLLVKDPQQAQQALTCRNLSSAGGLTYRWFSLDDWGKSSNGFCNLPSGKNMGVERSQF